MIDWTKPLEAYHPDGRVEPVTLEEDYPTPDDDGQYALDSDVVGLENCYSADGTHPRNKWRIRNAELEDKWSKLTVVEIEAEIAAAEKALEAKRAEPDYERFREAYCEFRNASGRANNLPPRCLGMNYNNKRDIDGLIAAYPKLKAIMEPQWIEWHGGECPVPAGADVEVEFRDGSKARHYSARAWYWGYSGHGADIIRYRVIDR